MKSKKILVLMVAVLLIIACMFAACGGGGGGTAGGGGGGGNDGLNLGRVMFDLSHPYQQGDAAQTEKYAASLGHSIIILDGKSAPDVISNAVDDLISKKVKGIIVQPVDGASINSVVKASQGAGIPIVTFFVQATEAPGPHVRINEAETSFENGAFSAGKWMEFHPDIPIKLAVIDIPDVPFVHEARTLAFIDGVKSVAPDAEVVAMLDGGGVRDKSLAAGDDLLQSQPDVNIVFGCNADSALGALAAFEAAGRGKAVDGVPVSELFVSIDGSEPEVLKILNPNSALKISQALLPSLNAKTNVDTLLKTINGEIGMTETIVVDTHDQILDFWRMTIEEFQKFLEVEYLSTVDLKAELADVLK